MPRVVPPPRAELISEHIRWRGRALSRERPPCRAELARHTARSLDHRRRESARRSSRKDTIGIPHHGDGADCLAGAVEDGCGDAGFTEDRLVALGGDCLETDGVELDAMLFAA